MVPSHVYTLHPLFAHVTSPMSQVRFHCVPRKGWDRYFRGMRCQARNVINWKGSDLNVMGENKRFGLTIQYTLFLDQFSMISFEIVLQLQTFDFIDTKTPWKVWLVGCCLGSFPRSG